MANVNQRIRVKLLKGVVTGIGTMAGAGEIVEFDRWTGLHLVNSGVAEIAEPNRKGGK